MPEDDSTQRLANRLADLRQLGDRNRAKHPVSRLRQDIAASQQNATQETAPGSPAPAHEPTLEERAEALARRVFSPVLARAEQLADRIRRRRHQARLEKRRQLEQTYERIEKVQDETDTSGGGKVAG